MSGTQITVTTPETSSLNNDSELEEIREELSEHVETVSEENAEEISEELSEQVSEEVAETGEEIKEEIKSWLESALAPISQAIRSLAEITGHLSASLSETRATVEQLTPQPLTETATDLNETGTETLSSVQMDNPESAEEENPVAEAAQEVAELPSRAREIIRL